MTKRTIYEHCDETGMTLEFLATVKDANAAQREWTAMGAETSIHSITYTPTKRGVVALLNSIKQEA
jgi:hypothetical protein